MTESADAGQLPTSAQVVPGGTTTLTGTLPNSADVDMYQIQITNPAAFSAAVAGAGDSMLALFTSAGHGVYFNDDLTGFEAPAKLPAGLGIGPQNPGIYYLAISEWNRRPVSAGGGIFPAGNDNHNDVLGPTGPGGGSAISGWVDPETVSAVLAYTINLTGVDNTPPVITPTVTGTIGANGWYTSNVSVSWAITDPDSAYSITGCVATTITSDTPGTTLSCSATSAGGTTGPVSVTIKRDATVPTLAPTATPNPVVLNGTTTVTANATDITSTIDTSSCTPVITSSIGAYTVACTATDKAGNSATANVTYTVGYKVCALYDQTKAHKLGSTVPIKLQLCDANGANVSAAGVVVHASSLLNLDSSASANVDDSGAANSPDNDFRYNATLGTTGGYIYNLSTKGLTVGTWQLSFTASGASYAVTFDVR